MRGRKAEPEERSLERGARIASPAYPLVPKASGLFGMSIAHEGELARGGSGPANGWVGKRGAVKVGLDSGHPRVCTVAFGALRQRRDAG